MIALWMLFVVGASAGFTVAAMAAERALRVWRRPARGVWAAAIVLATASAALMFVAPRIAPRAPQRPTAGAPAGMTRLSAFVVRAGGAARARRSPLRALDRPLAATWALGSLAIALLLVRGARRLGRARRRWAARTVAETRVLLSDDVGPAVVGVRQPAIVLPAWTLTLDEALLALVVRHETEHVRARDPALLTLGALALVAMPWNPVAWWMVGRLRLATELDCDARVLAGRGDPTRYGLLLLAVAQRRATASWTLSGAPALVESTSDLSRRIVAMRTSRSRHRVLASAAAVVVSSLGIAGAVAACAASRDVVGPGGKQAPNGPQALQLPAKTIVPGESLIGDVAAVVDAASQPGTSAPAPRPTPDRPRELPPGGAYFEFQVEHPVVQAPGSPGPRYPDALRDARIEGTVMAQFVVDTTGRVMPGSLRVLKAPADTAFVGAVRAALPNMRFEPALVGGRRVRQLVQQPFQFQLTK